MKRKVSVPLVRFSQMRDEILLRLSELEADRVFLCTNRGLFGEETQKEELDRLRDGIEFFQAHGYEVGIWLSSLGHGGSLSGIEEAACASHFTNIKGILGEAAADSFCPLDEGFASCYCAWVVSLATLGVSMIMFDDDFRMANRAGGFGCFCDRHLALFREAVGENVRTDELLKKIYCGGANKYRDAFLALTGKTLTDFAQKIRSQVDTVAPEVRLGVCACLSTWDSDGTDSIELSRIFAGKNKPFLRLIGAPYWATGNGIGRFAKKLAYIIELERMQAYWCRNSEIEIMAEGDVYPRPRYCVPAAYLEGFDTALIADGGTDGILKYAVDYSSSPVYEKGYTVRAERNKPIYRALEKCFENKTAVGVSAACEMKKLRNRVFPDEVLHASAYGEYSFIQPEQALLCDNSIPIKYGEGGVCVCFGQNAERLAVNAYDGFILDVPAALMLKSRGVDTGIISARALDAVSAEIFPIYNERVDVSGGKGLFSVTTGQGTEKLSFFECAGDYPSVYYYENKDGVRFAVLCADMDAARDCRGFKRSYMRQRQLTDLIERLGKKALPAVCRNNPDMYIMCKAGEGSLAVGLWNFFQDEVIEPVIDLCESYSQIEFINCDGVLNGSTVKLNDVIQPYAFAGFEVRK